MNPLRAAIAPYADLIRIVLSLIASLLLVALVWWAAIKPRVELAKAEKQLAEISAKSAAQEADAKVAQEQFTAGIAALRKEKDKGIEDAYIRGQAYGEDIAAGRRTVKRVWRDCPQAAAGEGSGPDPGDSGVSGDRARAIGEVLGFGGSRDAIYAEAYGRLEAAQKLLNQCYDKPAR